MTEDNEKRIFVQEIIICRKPKSKDIYKCSCFNNPFSGYLVCRAHPDYREGITRAEALGRISKAIAKDEWNILSSENDTFEAFFKRHKVAFDNTAKVALDAILGH